MPGVFAACVVSIAAAPAIATAQARAQEGGAARIPTDTATIGGQLIYEHVEGTKPWVMISGHRVFVPRLGVAAARLTVGERFGAVGIQGEAEAYPRLGTVGYLYAAAALSPSKETFVPLRAALELFTSPREALELSAGARLFQVSARSTVAYTGSIGAYRGNYWAALRPYVVRQNGSLSTTGQLSVRRYWTGRYDYVALYLSGIRGADVTANDPERLHRGPDLTAFSARVERLRPTRDGRLRIGYGLGIEREELADKRRRLHAVFTFRLERLLTGRRGPDRSPDAATEPTQLFPALAT